MRRYHSWIRRAGFFSAWMLIVLFAAGGASALNKPRGYPKRAVTILLCFGAGGGLDQMARALAAPASKIMGVRVNVVNKPGGAGVACLPDFFSAPADGYTILAHVDFLAAYYAAGRIDLDPRRDIIPLLTANIVPSQIYINAQDKRFLTGGKADFNKILAYARAHPGKMTVSNVSNPSGMEGVTMAVLERHFKIKTKQVPFDKPSERYAAVVGRHLDILMEQPGDVKSLLEGKKLLPALTVWPTRFKAFPDTPATGQDYHLDWKPILRWRALFVRKETPKPILDYLEAVFKAAWHGPDHQKFIRKKNLDILNSYLNSADTQKMIREEIVTYSKIYKELGLPIRK